MKKLFCIILSLVLVMSLPLTVSAAKIGSSSKEVTLEAIAGTAGVGSYEDFPKLLDGTVSSKWCVHFEDEAYVIFKTSEAVQLTGYTMVTGNDTYRYPERNPVSWRLYGASGSNAPNRDSSKWKKIDQVKNDDTLGFSNQTPYKFTLSRTADKYTYYMLVVDKIGSKDCMQLSEFQLHYKGGSTATDAAPASQTPPSQDSATPSQGLDADSRYFLGSAFIHGDEVFELQVGDSVTLYNPMVPSGAIYAYGWIISEGSSDTVGMDRYDGTCMFLAQKPGTVKVTALLDERLISGRQWTREYTFTIHVSKRTSTPTPSFGSVSDGVCPRCFGRRQIETARQGWITCTWCDGSGKWTN